MADPYSAAAAGIESGFGMAMRAREDAERQRRTKVIEDREAEQMRLGRERSDREERRLDRQERRGALQDRLALMDRGTRAAQGRQQELVGLSTAAQTAGQPVDPALAEEYGRNAEWLSRTRQSALDFFSRAQAGQIDPLEVSDDELYMHWTAATGMRPEELPQARQGIADVEAGLGTGNQGLVLQGVNRLMAPQLRVGVGSPSPHGGTIERKEIIGLDPARDANGREWPNMVIPRLRVYVKTDKGETRYYDAPITKNRTGDPDDPVVPLDITRAMDWMGNLGVLTQAAQNPVVAEKLANGAKGAGAQAQRYLDELTMLGRPKKPQMTRRTTDLKDRVLLEDVGPAGNVVSSRTEKYGAPPRTFRPGSSGGGGSGGGARGVLQAKLDEIERMEVDGEVSSEEAVELRKATVASIKPAQAKAPNAKEVSDDETAALNAVAGRMGLDYDATTKSYRSRDGKSITPEQRERLGAARTAIQAAARAAAGRNERATPEALAAAANEAKPTKTVKWGDLK